MTVGDLHAEWRDDAKCFDYFGDPIFESAWDVERSELHGHAKRICEEVCPVRLACLQDALLDPEAEGMRGGYVFENGRLPLAKAREIKSKLGLMLGPWQRLWKGR